MARPIPLMLRPHDPTRNFLSCKTLETIQPELFAGCTQAIPNALVQASRGRARLWALLGAHT